MLLKNLNLLKSLGPDGKMTTLKKVKIDVLSYELLQFEWRTLGFGYGIICELHFRSCVFSIWTCLIALSETLSIFNILRLYWFMKFTLYMTATWLCQHGILIKYGTKCSNVLCVACVVFSWISVLIFTVKMIFCVTLVPKSKGCAGTL